MDSLLTCADVCKAVKVSRQTVYKWRLSGKFPQPVDVGSRVLRWRESDVQAWIASR